ncbi:MAG: zinc ribbon domain-containing protein [Planctomycetota bacterium]
MSTDHIVQSHPKATQIAALLIALLASAAPTYAADPPAPESKEQAEPTADSVRWRVYPELDVQFVAPGRAREVPLSDGVRLRLPEGASVTLRRTKSARDLEAVKLRLEEAAASAGWTVLEVRERTVGDRSALELRCEFAIGPAIGVQQIVGIARDEALYVWVFADRKDRFPSLLAERMLTSFGRIDPDRLAEVRKANAPDPGYGCPTCREAKPASDRFCGVCGATCRNLPLYGCSRCDRSFTDDHKFCTDCGEALERLSTGEDAQEEEAESLPSEPGENDSGDTKKPGASQDETPGR